MDKSVIDVTDIDTPIVFINESFSIKRIIKDYSVIFVHYMSVYLIFLTVPTVYIILSFIFLRKPNWLHKRRRPAFIVRNIAHRGGKIIEFLYI